MSHDGNEPMGGNPEDRESEIEPEPAPESAPEPAPEPEPAPPAASKPAPAPSAKTAPAPSGPVQAQQWGSPDEHGLDHDHDEPVKSGQGTTRIIIIAALVFVAVVVAVGGYMGWRFSMRFSGLEKCKAHHLDGDEIKPEFAGCVRDVAGSTGYDDVKVEAVSLMVMAEDREAIPVLIRMLDDGGEPMRQASQAIAEIGGEEAQQAREPLAGKLAGAGPRDKVILAWALASLGDERAFRPLLDGYIEGYTRELSGWDDNFLVDYAANDPAALEEMIKLVDSDDPAHRWFAATTLGKYRDPRVVDPLLKLLGDDNRNVVKAAAISLGATGDDRAGEAILKVLNQYPDMTDELLNAIQQSVGAPGLAAVYARVDTPSRKNKIVNLVREIRDPRSGDILLAMLADVEKETQGKGPGAGVRTRKEIALALADLGDERAIPLLKEFIYLADVNSACKLYDCGQVNLEEMSDEQKESYLRGYRLSPVVTDMVKGLVNIGTPEAKAVILDLWRQIIEANQKYGADSYLYWVARPALVMSSLGHLGGPEVGPLLEGQVCSNAEVNMRAKALNVGKTMDLSEPCPDVGAASRALGRIKYEPIIEKWLEIAKRPEGIDFSVPNVDNESFYMDRKAIMQGMAYMGSSRTFEAIVTIIEDPLDDFRTREDAAYPLAYCIDETNRDLVIEKVTSSATDLPVRILFANALKFQSDSGTATRLLPLISDSSPNALLVPIAKVLGESCDPSIMDSLVQVVTKDGEQAVDSLGDHQVAALFAITMCGEEKHVQAILPFLGETNTQDIIRHHYEEHPLYLTTEAFDSGRILKKLRTARFLYKREVTWPWAYMMGRLEVGFEDNPDGLSLMQIRKRMMDLMKNGQPWEQELAAWSLLGMKDKGYLLAVAAEGGAPAKVARDVIRLSEKGL